MRNENSMGVAFTPSLTRRKAEIVVAVAGMIKLGMDVTGASLFEEIGEGRTRSAMSSMLKTMVLEGWLVVKGAVGRSTRYGIAPEAEITISHNGDEYLVTVRYANNGIVTGRFAPKQKKENKGA